MLFLTALTVSLTQRSVLITSVVLLEDVAFTIKVSRPCFLVRRCSSSRISQHRVLKGIAFLTIIIRGLLNSTLTLCLYTSVRLLINYEFISYIGLLYLRYIAISCRLIRSITTLKSFIELQDTIIVFYYSFQRLQKQLLPTSLQLRVMILRALVSSSVSLISSSTSIEQLSYRHSSAYIFLILYQQDRTSFRSSYLLLKKPQRFNSIIALLKCRFQL